MTRTRPTSAEEARDALLDAAEQLVRIDRTAVVVITRGAVHVVRAEAAAGPPPEGVSEYDTAILAALSTEPLTSRRLARVAGCRFNSWFRERLAQLVEAGRVLHTRRGYSRPPG